MSLQDIIYASDIRGYCTLDVCWRFIYDIATQLKHKAEKGEFRGAITLNDIQICGKNFTLEALQFSHEGDVCSEVWSLATAVFELMLGTPIFNSKENTAQTTHAPLPSLIGKEMVRLNQLLHRCLQKEKSLRPELEEIINIAAEEIDKSAQTTRKARVYSHNHPTLCDEDYDSKWPEQMTNIRRGLVCLLLLIITTLSASSQTILDKDKELNTIKLVEATLLLRNNTQQSWNEAENQLSTLLRLFTVMDELQDDDNDCSLISKNVKSFGLNRMVKHLKEVKSIVQNTGKGLLDGADSRFNYSIYEKGVKKGCCATYNKLSGRTGKQVFVIIPYSAKQPYETELQSSRGVVFEPSHRDNNGITYYCIDTPDGPTKEEALVLKITNNDSINNHSFVIINHNYRNK